MNDVIPSRCADLVRGASLRGPAARLTATTTLRLGRAIAGEVRRRTPGIDTVLIGRGADAADVDVRNGLVAGLVLGGVHVVDLGVVESDRFTAALRAGPPEDVRGADAWPAAAGILIASTSDSVGVMIFSGTRPIVGDGLTQIAAAADRGTFVAVDGGRITRIDGALLPWPRPTAIDEFEALDEDVDSDVDSDIDGSSDNDHGGDANRTLAD